MAFKKEGILYRSIDILSGTSHSEGTKIKLKLAELVHESGWGPSEGLLTTDYIQFEDINGDYLSYWWDWPEQLGVNSTWHDIDSIGTHQIGSDDATYVIINTPWPTSGGAGSTFTGTARIVADTESFAVESVPVDGSDVIDTPEANGASTFFREYTDKTYNPTDEGYKGTIISILWEQQDTGSLYQDTNIMGINTSALSGSVNNCGKGSVLTISGLDENDAGEDISELNGTYIVAKKTDSTLIWFYNTLRTLTGSGIGALGVSNYGIAVISPLNTLNEEDIVKFPESWGATTRAFSATDNWNNNMNMAMTAEAIGT